MLFSNTKNCPGYLCLLQSARSAILILAMIMMSPSAFGEIAIIGHPSAPTLTKSMAAEIFLAKLQEYPNGKPAKPYDLPSSNRLRKEFYEGLVSRTEAQLKAYWSRLIFTGAGKPPKILDDADEMKEIVAEDPTAIGYIKAKDVDDTVKVLFVLGK